MGARERRFVSAASAQLGMPINIHMSDPIWSYQPQDANNDGLMNGYTWRIDDKGEASNAFA